MSLTFVQDNHTTFGITTSANLAFTSNTTAKSFLIAWAQIESATNNPTLSDSLGNTWIRFDVTQNLFGETWAGWYCAKGKGGANTVTISLSSANIQLAIAEYTGQLLLGSPIDFLQTPIIVVSNASSHTYGPYVASQSETLIFLGWAPANSTSTFTISGLTQRYGPNSSDGSFLMDGGISSGSLSPVVNASPASTLGGYFLGVRLVTGFVPSSWVTKHRDFINKR